MSDPVSDLVALARMFGVLERDAVDAGRQAVDRKAVRREPRRAREGGLERQDAQRALGQRLAPPVDDRAAQRPAPR